MTFLEALNTGYRITNRTWLHHNFWAKKINNIEFTYDSGSRFIIADHFLQYKGEWFVHPEDQKLIEFNNKLEEVLR